MNAFRELCWRYPAAARVPAGVRFRQLPNALRSYVGSESTIFGLCCVLFSIFGRGFGDCFFG